jgi:hypothetical protein
MNESVDVAQVRYAVLEVPRTKGGSECFVVAYPNEDCLYGVIAAPRIVACGFCSREAAFASSVARLSTASEHKQVPRAPRVERALEPQHGVHCPELRSDADLALRVIRRFLVGFYNDVVAAGILIFSSRNIVSSAIRTFLAASF